MLFAWRESPATSPFSLYLRGSPATLHVSIKSITIRFDQQSLSLQASVSSTMAANMSGLASLAMAIDHLDEVQKTAKAPVSSMVEQQNFASRNNGYHAWDVTTSSTRMPLPKRQPYIETRVVSLEAEDTSRNTTTAVAPPKEEENDGAIELLLKNSSGDAPPAPPSPEEVIDQVLENDVLVSRHYCMMSLESVVVYVMLFLLNLVLYSHYSPCGTHRFILATTVWSRW